MSVVKETGWEKEEWRQGQGAAGGHSSPRPASCFPSLILLQLTSTSVSPSDFPFFLCPTKTRVSFVFMCISLCHGINVLSLQLCWSPSPSVMEFGYELLRDEVRWDGESSTLVREGTTDLACSFSPCRMRTWEEGGHLQAQKKALPEPCWHSVSDCENFQLLELWEVCACHSSHSACGIYYGNLSRLRVSCALFPFDSYRTSQFEESEVLFLPRRLPLSSSQVLGECRPKTHFATRASLHLCFI